MKIKCNHIQLSLPACACPSLSFSLCVCACDTVDNAVVVAVEVVVSHSHPTPHQHCTLHSACPFCSRVVGRALFSHEIPLLFQLLLLLLLFSPFFFVLSFSCFVHGEFFFYILFARAFAPFAFNFLTLSRFFFGVSGKGLKTWVRSECPCVCVCVCAWPKSSLKFSCKKDFKASSLRTLFVSFRFAFCAPCSEYISYSFIFPFTDPFSLHFSLTLSPSVWTKKFVRQSFCLLLLVMAR